ncbi:hypothetical protein SEVIR_2G453466v4 [Setaria viridis]|uniref:Uncharacterized protein n=1 Tax=Setaria viridis TaxID=4556 RepID=A0A4U6W2F9_SETVI|nr:hypothetical protein SEVIR_2G453466v2 [Setaria viridis]
MNGNGMQWISMLLVMMIIEYLCCCCCWLLHLLVITNQTPRITAIGCCPSEARATTTPRSMPGYVCACDVVPLPPTAPGLGARQGGRALRRRSGGRRPEAELHDACRHGRRGILHPRAPQHRRGRGDAGHGHRLLRVTKFRLQRARHGHLRTSSRRIARSDYRLHKYDRNFAPQAFCMFF